MKKGEVLPFTLKSILSRRKPKRSDSVVQFVERQTERKGEGENVVASLVEGQGER